MSSSSDAIPPARRPSERMRAQIMGAAGAVFPGETVDVIAPGDPASDGGWGIYVGAERETCYRVAVLSGGTLDFERID